MIKKILLKKCPVDFRRVNEYLAKAKGDLLNAKKILAISEEISFKTTYDAMIKITLALMLAHGVRPRTQSGHHLTMIQFAKNILPKEQETLINRYDRIRAKRHLLVYEASWVSRQEAEEAILAAEKYWKIVKEYIQAKNPQKKLL